MAIEQIANVGVDRRFLADAEWALGRPRESIDEFEAAIDTYAKTETASLPCESRRLSGAPRRPTARARRPRNERALPLARLSPI